MTKDQRQTLREYLESIKQIAASSRVQSSMLQPLRTRRGYAQTQTRTLTIFKHRDADPDGWDLWPLE